MGKRAGIWHVAGRCWRTVQLTWLELRWVGVRMDGWLRATFRGHRPLTPKQIAEIVARDKVPTELVPFVDFLEEWGATQSDTQRYEYADFALASPPAMNRLREFARQMTPELMDAVLDWRRSNSFTSNPTTAKFYFTMLLLDELSLHLPAAIVADPVGHLLSEISKPDFDDHFAIGSLVELEPEPEPSVVIPVLESLLKSERPLVRAAAHYGLGRLTGEIEFRQQQIDLIISSLPEQSAERIFAGSYSERLSRTLEQHRILALCCAGITNDVRQIRELVKKVDVNGVDHHGGHPLEAAVGNGHLEAAQALLENGADVTLLDRLGGGVLQRAATWPHNVAMLKLLTDHGADLFARDASRRNAFETAVMYQRVENARWLASMMR